RRRFAPASTGTGWSWPTTSRSAAQRRARPRRRDQAGADEMMVKGYRRPRALPASAAISVVALVAAACGSGRPTVERHLVFVRATTPENAVIWIADADGSNRRRLAGGLSAVVSPDGRTIATGRPDGIHLISSDGKRDRHL